MLSCLYILLFLLVTNFLLEAFTRRGMPVSATYSTFHQHPPVIIQYTVIPEWFILMHVSA